MPSGVYLHKQVPVKERFWRNVKIKDEKECWEWLRATNEKGYGIFGIKISIGNWKNIKAHRMAWILTHGKIPKGEGYHGTCVLHHCDNPGCMNPKHLFLGTNADNMRDKARKGRSNGEWNNNNKLNNSEVRQIRRSHANGTSMYRLAKMFNVTICCIKKIVTRETWRHI